MGQKFNLFSGLSIICIVTSPAWADDSTNGDIIRFNDTAPIPAPSILSSPHGPTVRFPQIDDKNTLFPPKDPNYPTKPAKKSSWLSIESSPSPTPLKPALPANRIPFTPPAQLPPSVVNKKPAPAAGFNYDIFRQSIEAELEQAAKRAPIRPAPQINRAEQVQSAPRKMLQAPSTTLSPDLSQQLHDLVSLQAAMQKNLQENQKQLAAANERYSALQAKKDEQSRALLEKTGELEAQHSQLTTENALLKKEISSLKESISRLQNELKNEQQYKASLEQKVTAGEKKVQSLQTVSQERDALFSKLQHSLQQENESSKQLSTLQSQLKSAEAKIKTMSTRLDEAASLAPRLQNLEAENSKLHRELADAQQKASTQTDSLRDAMAKLATSSTLVASLQSSLAQAEKKPDLTADLASTKTALEAAKSEKTSLATQLKQAQEQLAALKTTHGEKMSACNAIENTLEQRTAEATECALQIDTLQKQLSEREAANQALTLKTTDSDHDGINDHDDQCPNTPKGATVDAQGCLPDQDADKVSDANDLCPNSPSGTKVDILGCEPRQPITLEGLQFKTGSARFDEKSLGILEKLAVLLKQTPELNLEIAGHTDNVGDRERNITLSNRRAEAVKNKLIELGIDAGRLTAKGYGPDEPVADNASAEGRATNRRVELRR